MSADFNRALNNKRRTCNLRKKRVRKTKHFYAAVCSKCENKEIAYMLTIQELVYRYCANILEYRKAWCFRLSSYVTCRFFLC